MNTEEVVSQDRTPADRANLYKAVSQANALYTLEVRCQSHSSLGRALLAYWKDKDNKFLLRNVPVSEAGEDKETRIQSLKTFFGKLLEPFVILACYENFDCETDIPTDTRPRALLAATEKYPAIKAAVSSMMLARINRISPILLIGFRSFSLQFFPSQPSSEMIMSPQEKADTLIDKVVQQIGIAEGWIQKEAPEHPKEQVGQEGRSPEGASLTL